MLFPHLLSVVHQTLVTSPLPLLPAQNIFSSIPMDNFDINADPYFPSSALWSPDVHPFLSTASANEGFDNYGMRGTMANYLEPPTPMSESALAHMNYGEHRDNYLDLLIVI